MVPVRRGTPTKDQKIPIRKIQLMKSLDSLLSTLKLLRGYTGKPVSKSNIV